MIRSMYSDSSLPRSFKGVPICRLTYEDYGGFSHSLKDYKVFIFLKKDYMRDLNLVVERYSRSYFLVRPVHRQEKLLTIT